jgi:hypothetical protein
MVQKMNDNRTNECTLDNRTVVIKKADVINTLSV